MKICSVSYHGQYKKKQVEIGRDVNTLFSSKKRKIILEFDGKKHYSKLPNSFFTICRHLRTAYKDNTYNGKNELHEWLDKNNVKKVLLETIKPYVHFRLSKES